MRQRKVPLRKCIACQEMRPKKELIRVTKTVENKVFLDVAGKKNGRGAYLCGRLPCFTLARKSRVLDRALNHQVQAELYEQLAIHLGQVAADLHPLQAPGDGEDD